MEECCRTLLEQAASWPAVVYSPETQRQAEADGTLGVFDDKGSRVIYFAGSATEDTSLADTYTIATDMNHRVSQEATPEAEGDEEKEDAKGDDEEQPSPSRGPSPRAKQVHFYMGHHLQIRVPTVFTCATYAPKPAMDEPASAPVTPPRAFVVNFDQAMTIHAEAPVVFIGVHFRAPIRVMGPGPVSFLECCFCEMPLITRCQVFLKACPDDAGCHAAPEYDVRYKQLKEDGEAQQWDTLGAAAVEVVGDSTRAFFSDCDFCASLGGRGLSGSDKSDILVMNSSFLGAAFRWAAVETEGACSLTMRDTSLSDLLSCGVVALDTSTVRIYFCNIVRCGLVGVFAGNTATVEMVNTAVLMTASGTNIVASCSSTVTLDATTVTALLPAPDIEEIEEIDALLEAARASPEAHAEALRALFTMEHGLLRGIAKRLTQSPSPSPSSHREEEDDPERVVGKMPLSSQSVLVVGRASLVATRSEFSCEVSDYIIAAPKDGEGEYLISSACEDLFYTTTRDPVKDAGTGTDATRSFAQVSGVLPDIPSVARAIAQQQIRSRVVKGTYYNEICHASAIALICASGFPELVGNEPPRPTVNMTKAELRRDCAARLPGQIAEIRARLPHGGSSDEGQTLYASSDLLFPLHAPPLPSGVVNAPANPVAIAPVTLDEAVPALLSSVIALGAHPALTSKGTYHIVARMRARVELHDNLFSLVSTYDQGSTITTEQHVGSGTKHRTAAAAKTARDGGSKGNTSPQNAPSIINFSFAHGSVTENCFGTSVAGRSVSRLSSHAMARAGARANGEGVCVDGADGSVSTPSTAGVSTYAVEVCERAYPCAAVVVDLMPLRTLQMVCSPGPTPSLLAVPAGSPPLSPTELEERRIAAAQLLGVPPYGASLITERNTLRYEPPDAPEEEGAAAGLAPKEGGSHVYRAPHTVNKSAFGLVVVTPSPLLTPNLFSSSLPGVDDKDTTATDGAAPPLWWRHNLATAIDTAAQKIEQDWCRGAGLDALMDASPLSPPASPSSGLQPASGAEDNAVDSNATTHNGESNPLHALASSSPVDSAIGSEGSPHTSQAEANCFINVHDPAVILTKVVPQHVATRLTLFAAMNGFLPAAQAVYGAVTISAEDYKELLPKSPELVEGPPLVPAATTNASPIPADVMNSSDAPPVLRALSTTPLTKNSDPAVTVPGSAGLLSGDGSLIGDEDAPPGVRQTMLSGTGSGSSSFNRSADKRKDDPVVSGEVSSLAQHVLAGMLAHGFAGFGQACPPPSSRDSHISHNSNADHKKSESVTTTSREDTGGTNARDTGDRSPDFLAATAPEQEEREHRGELQSFKGEEEEQQLVQMYTAPGGKPLEPGQELPSASFNEDEEWEMVESPGSSSTMLGAKDLTHHSFSPSAIARLVRDATGGERSPRERTSDANRSVTDAARDQLLAALAAHSSSFRGIRQGVTEHVASVASQSATAAATNAEATTVATTTTTTTTITTTLPLSPGPPDPIHTTVPVPTAPSAEPKEEKPSLREDTPLAFNVSGRGVLWDGTTSEMIVPSPPESTRAPLHASGYSSPLAEASYEDGLVDHASSEDVACASSANVEEDEEPAPPPTRSETEALPVSPTVPRPLTNEEEAAERHGFTDTPLFTTPFKPQTDGTCLSSGTRGPATADTVVATPMHDTQAMMLMLRQELLDLKRVVVEQQQQQQVQMQVQTQLQSAAATATTATSAAASPDMAQRAEVRQAATVALAHTQRPSQKRLHPTVTSSLEASADGVGRRLRLDAVEGSAPRPTGAHPDSQDSPLPSSPAEMPSSIHSRSTSSELENTDGEGPPYAGGKRDSAALPNTAAGKLFLARTRHAQRRTTSKPPEPTVPKSPFSAGTPPRRRRRSVDAHTQTAGGTIRPRAPSQSGGSTRPATTASGSNDVVNRLYPSTTLHAMFGAAARASRPASADPVVVGPVPTPVIHPLFYEALLAEQEAERAANAAARRWHLCVMRDLLRANLGSLPSGVERAWAQDHAVAPRGGPKPRAGSAASAPASSVPVSSRVPYLYSPYRPHSPSGGLGTPSGHRPRRQSRPPSTRATSPEVRPVPPAEPMPYNPNKFLHPEPSGTAAVWGEEADMPTPTFDDEPRAMRGGGLPFPRGSALPSHPSGMHSLASSSSAMPAPPVETTAPPRGGGPRDEAEVPLSDWDWQRLSEWQALQGAECGPRRQRRGRQGNKQTRVSSQSSAMTGATHARTGWDDIVSQERERAQHQPRLSPHRLNAQVHRLYTQPMLAHIHRELTAPQREQQELRELKGCTFHPNINPPKPPPRRRSTRSRSTSAGRPTPTLSRPKTVGPKSNRTRAQSMNYPTVPRLPLETLTTRAGGRGGDKQRSKSAAKTLTAQPAVGRWTPRGPAEAYPNGGSIEQENSDHAPNGKRIDSPSLLPTDITEERSNRSSIVSDKRAPTAVFPSDKPDTLPKHVTGPNVWDTNGTAVSHPPKLSVNMLRTAAARTAAASGERSGAGAANATRRRLVLSRQTEE